MILPLHHSTLVLSDIFIWTHNAAGEQRPKFTPILHGLYGKPLPTRRLLHWFVMHESLVFITIFEFYRYKPSRI